MTHFSLDPRLERDSLALATSEHCDLRLFNDARYVWLVLIPRQPDAVEWFDLPASWQQAVMGDTLSAGRSLKQMGAHKVNIGALGNMVPQLHIHIVARQPDDPAWPGPVWGHSPAAPYDTETVNKVRQRVLAVLEASFVAA